MRIPAASTTSVVAAPVTMLSNTSNLMLLSILWVAAKKNCIATVTNSRLFSEGQDYPEEVYTVAKVVIDIAGAEKKIREAQSKLALVLGIDIWRFRYLKFSQHFIGRFAV